MKSDFSRILHHTSSLSDLIRQSRWNKFATWFDLDHRVKPDGDSIVNADRSMVEMLGVLAIIGVLSVGAIAGYSKAMMKYKLNKQAQGFSFLLNEAIKIKEEMWTRLLKHNESLSAELVGILTKTNSVPDGFTYDLSKSSVYDTFKNPIQFYCYATDTYAEYMLAYNMTKSSYSVEICRNMVLAAKENTADLYFLQMRSVQEAISANYLYGDRKCNSSHCLRSAGIKEIDDFCSSCANNSNCTLFVYLDHINF